MSDSQRDDDEDIDGLALAFVFYNAYIELVRFHDANNPPPTAATMVNKTLCILQQTLLKESKGGNIHKCIINPVKDIENVFKNYVMGMPKKKSIFSGPLPRDLREMQTTLTRIKNFECPIDAGLASIIFDLKKSGNHLPVLEAAIKCQAKLFGNFNEIMSLSKKTLGL